MSYTDYLNRMKINSPVLIDARMRMPDASSFTWRTKLAATRINRRTDHVINNSQDTPAPRLFSPQVMGYPGSGFGGRVQDASSFTLAQSAGSLGHDVFSGYGGGRHRTSTNAIFQCLTRPPASQVVSEFGNAEDKDALNIEDSPLAGLNMGYMRQIYIVNAPISPAPPPFLVGQAELCTSEFHPLTKSQFVDTIPDLKTHKIGTQSRDPGDHLGRQRVQNTIRCVTTNTSGDAKGEIADANGINLPTLKDIAPFNSYSALPNNSVGSGANLVHGAFVTGVQGPQVGGSQFPNGRADKAGGISVVQKGVITHRGWGGRTRMPYPYPRVPPRGAPAQKKINEPNHYKV